MKRLALVLATLFAAVALHAAPITLRVDATGVPRTSITRISTFR